MKLSNTALGPFTIVALLSFTAQAKFVESKYFCIKDSQYGLERELNSKVQKRVKRLKKENPDAKYEVTLGKIEKLDESSGGFGTGNKYFVCSTYKIEKITQSLN